ncbi:hypothetical protein DIJ64_00850 [Mycobacterium leprae]|uniref:Uncharacterized protein n=1 Tax=Mycobacterium leprae TaxID=1769 RepID=A0AAD0P7M2_MYCLR|nr:hypothetical protein DIJ64_00850 [Mycobacterium leprae]OAR20654.1 hypothetical protein A8144_09955 [Mycobacterium leprae 3125609]OAX70867.1 hypothetical protein A3216_09435 [Mycobacterium leprae 7935681]
MEVSETYYACAGYSCFWVDTSFSMFMENSWLKMKRTELALNHLVCTQLRLDVLQIIAFGH